MQQLLAAHVIEELLADGEGSPADVHLCFACREDLILPVPQEVLDVLRLVGRADGLLH